MPEFESQGKGDKGVVEEMKEQKERLFEEASEPQPSTLSEPLKRKAPNEPAAGAKKHTMGGMLK